MLAIPETQPVVVEEVYFDSAGYRLHGELVYAEAGHPSGAVVVAGPHPLLGGNMHNNVVRGMSDGLAQHGLIALRFNYRGVGGSEGPRIDVQRNLALFWETSHVPEEMELRGDVQAAVQWLRSAAGAAMPLAVAGYSFGCALLAGIATPRVLIAPTVAKHDYSELARDRRPTLVIASEDDFATDVASLRAWFATLAEPKLLVLKQFDNHFFRGHEAWLAQRVATFLRQPWEVTP